MRGEPMTALYRDVLDDNAMGLADFVEGKPRALLVSELADLLNISTRQVYNLVAKHRVPHLRIAGCIRFDPLALAIWLRQKSGTEKKQ